MRLRHWLLAGITFLGGCATSPPPQPTQIVDSPEVLPETELRQHQGTNLPKKITPGTVDDYYWQIHDRLMADQKRKYPKKSQTYHQWAYRHDYPKTAQRWTSQSLLVFPDGTGKVTQIGLESYECGIGISPAEQAVVADHFNALLSRETNDLLGQPIIMDETDFKGLGPQWSSKVQYELPTPIAGTTRVRLTREKHNCNGQGGFGYRLDVFLAN